MVSEVNVDLNMAELDQPSRSRAPSQAQPLTGDRRLSEGVTASEINDNSARESYEARELEQGERAASECPSSSPEASVSIETSLTKETPNQTMKSPNQLTEPAVESALQDILNKFPDTAIDGEERTNLVGSKAVHDVNVSHFDEPMSVNQNLVANTELISDSKNGQPLVQEVPKFVPRVEVHEIRREVFKPEIEWVERVVEVPQVQYVDKYEEVPQVQYVPRHVPKIEIVEVPREVIKHVPRLEVKTVEKIVNVPSGEKIPVPNFYGVTTEYVVPQFFDQKIPVIASRQIQPEIIETDQVLEVPATRYRPYLVPVEVYVPKPVSVPCIDRGVVDQSEIPATNVDIALLQQMTAEMNPHLQYLEVFNKAQHETFQQLIQQSQEQAAIHNLVPPPPITLPLTSYERKEHYVPEVAQMPPPKSTERRGMANDCHSDAKNESYSRTQQSARESSIHARSLKKSSACASIPPSRRSSTAKSFSVATAR